ncbi:MAG: hypothetical protein ACP5I4_10735 [Oceanipulchritudo sp.]
MNLIAATHPFVHSLEHVLGFLIVLVALTLLWTLTALIGRFFIGREAAAPASGSGPPAEEGPSEEEVAAITAAVMSLIGSRSRIVSIRSSRTQDWSREGRREHFSSHKIR